MRAVDTNLVVLLFVQDEAEQVKAARQALTTDTIFIPKSVIVEFEWVMRGAYRESRAAIASAIEAILATANVEVEDAAAVTRAVDWFRRGMDFADALHLSSSSHVDCFVTFDTAMRRRARALAVKPEVIAP
ncbi:MAG: type II toxin-antitoxin system VapC family toxin [Proteobacteria bacterium]|nr:type II toxin-antitoxin system VapC family toxin [Pseudomonadota bacterium]